MATEKPVVRASLLVGQRLLGDALRCCLQTSGIQVVGCYPEPAGFVAHLRDDAPDVAVLDVLLPRAARGVVEQTVNARPGQKILVLTSTSDSHANAACEAAGATALLDRFHSNADDLAKMIRSVATEEQPARTGRTDRSRSRSKVTAFAGISQRELEVLAHIGAGMDNLKIASMLGISEHTVKAHVGQLYRKLGRENRTEMALLARDLGLTVMP